jgi:ATP-dependent Clp protease ATP-binding subunit ClpC
MNEPLDLSAFTVTERLKKIMRLATDEAVKGRHQAVAPEHLLIGIVNDGEGPAVGIMEALDISPQTVRLRTKQAMTSDASAIPVPDPPYSPEALIVLQGAMAEAKEWGHSHLGSEHLLIGLLREGKSLAAQVMYGLGLTLAEARDQTRQLLSP